jgi:hypothetical protein
MKPKMLKIHTSAMEYFDLNNNAITAIMANTAAIRSPYAAGAAKRGSRGEIVIPGIRKESPM